MVLLISVISRGNCKDNVILQFNVDNSHSLISDKMNFIHYYVDEYLTGFIM